MMALTGRVGTIALIVSYIFDWAVILITAGVSAVFAHFTPNKRPFSPVDPYISFPFTVHEKVSTAVLIVCGLVIPGVLILIFALLLVPGHSVQKSTPKALVWQRKLWEWNSGWLGLGLSLASAWLITSGLKNIIGKPRPDLLSRCVPNTDNIQDFAVGAYSNTTLGVILVSADVCQSTDTSRLNDGFRSFPSGHASFSAAGLIYLSLFAASKFGVAIPFFAFQPYGSETTSHLFAFPSRIPKTLPPSGLGAGTIASSPLNEDTDEHLIPSGRQDAITAARKQAAAPPIYLILLAAVPTLAAMYIASTRYSDFRHHGFDVLAGFFIGTVTAITAFRIYHLPINRGGGWSWGPRSKERSFWAGVGVNGYAKSKSDRRMGNSGQKDIEMGPINSEHQVDRSDQA